MKLVFHLFLSAILVFVIASCNNDSEPQEPQESETIAVDTVHVSDLTPVVSTESALLGEPRDIVSIDDGQIGVYDHAYEKINIFDSEGNKQDEFGRVGEGPGEWDPMSGASDLNFLSGQFFTSNTGQFQYDLYDRSGNHIKTIPFPQYLSYSHKTLLPDNKLLVETKGRENALAAVYDLNGEGTIVKTIGSPEADYPERRQLEQERMTYANGEIPEHSLNEVLAAKGEDGYVLFMNTLGELRHYSDGGELLWQQSIPENIKKAHFDYVVNENKDLREYTVFPLRYAQEMKVQDDLIYLFLPKPTGEADNFNFRMLVYNTTGNLMKHYLFADPENEFYFFDISISRDNRMYMMDVTKSEILKFSPSVE